MRRVTETSFSLPSYRRPVIGFGVASSELGKAASSAIAGRVAASLESALASKRRMASDREGRGSGCAVIQASI